MRRIQQSLKVSRYRSFCMASRPDTQNVENMTQIGTRRIFKTEHDHCMAVYLFKIATFNIKLIYSSRNVQAIL